MLSATPPPLDDEALSFEKPDNNWANDDFCGFQEAGTNNSNGDDEFMDFADPVSSGFQPVNCAGHGSASPTTTHRPTAEKTTPNGEEFAKNDSLNAASSGACYNEGAICDNNDELGNFQQVGSSKSSEVNHSHLSSAGSNTTAADLDSSSSSVNTKHFSSVQKSKPPNVRQGDSVISPRTSSSDGGSFETQEKEICPPDDLKPLNSKCHKSDAQDNTSQDSVTDSGLCSDISPVPKFDEYPDFGDAKGSHDSEDMGVFHSDNESKMHHVPTRDSGIDFGQEEEFIDFQKHDQKEDLEPLDFRPVSFSEDVQEDDDDNFGQFRGNPPSLDDSDCDRTSSPADVDSERSEASRDQTSTPENRNAAAEDDDSKSETLKESSVIVPGESEDFADFHSATDEDFVSVEVQNMTKPHDKISPAVTVEDSSQSDSKHCESGPKEHVGEGEIGSSEEVSNSKDNEDEGSGLQDTNTATDEDEFGGFNSLTVNEVSVDFASFDDDSKNDEDEWAFKNAEEEDFGGFTGPTSGGDDFANFGEPAVPCGEAGDDGNWAAFSSSTDPPPISEDINEDDFQDFQEVQHQKPNINIQELLQKQQVWVQYCIIF